MRRCPFSTFMFGVLVGTVIGVLIAPKSGKETIEELSIKANDTKEKVKKKASDTKYDIEGVTDTIKDTITLYTGSSIKEVEEESLFEKEFDV